MLFFFFCHLYLLFHQIHKPCLILDIIDFLQFLFTFSTHCLLVNIEIFLLLQLFLTALSLVKHLHQLNFHTCCQHFLMIMLKYLSVCLAKLYRALFCLILLSIGFIFSLAVSGFLKPG